MFRQSTSATDTVFIRSFVRHGTMLSSSSSLSTSKTPWRASLRKRRIARSVNTEPAMGRDQPLAAEAQPNSAFSVGCLRLWRLQKPKKKWPAA